jgi:hypothetical protein
MGLCGKASSLIIYRVRRGWYQLVQVVPQEVGADATPVSVVHAEEGALGPDCAFEYFGFWLHDV